MKKLFGITLLFWMIFSSCSFAAKIVITGKPVILQKQSDVYYVPDKYQSSTNYYYVIVDGASRVCYLEKQPSLSALNTMVLSVNFMGSQMNWVCYPLDPNYFQTQ